MKAEEWCRSASDLGNGSLTPVLSQLLARNLVLTRGTGLTVSVTED